MKKYFVYELKKNLPAIGFITLAAVIIYVFPLLLVRSDEFRFGNSLATISSIGGVLAVLAPIWLYEYKMKRRSIDLFYALPLSHTKILVAKFLFGLLVIFIPYTAAYWLGMIVTWAKAYKVISVVWFVPQFFGSIIPIYIIYAMSAFVFTRANKPLDGVLFIVFWTFALTLVAHILLMYIPTANEYPFYLSFNISNAFLPFEPLDRLTTVMNGRIIRDYYYENIERSYQIAMIIGFTVTILLAAGATVGLILTEKHNKAENAGQISESWYGYKVMLPLYTFCLPILFDLSDLGTLVLILIVELAMFAVTILYKRSIKIGKIQAIIFTVSALAGIVISLISSIAT